MELVSQWRARQARGRLVRRVAAARRSGHGLFLQDWHLPPPAHLSEDPHGAWVDTLLSWCRKVLAECRRPWGIDYFDLTLAWRDAAGGRPRRLHWRRLRPAELYGTGRLTQQLHVLLARAQPDGPRPALLQADGVDVAVGLFSWGEAVHAALPPHVGTRH